MSTLVTATKIKAEIATEPARSSRGPRRLTARRKLIVAAYDVMSRNGLDGSTLAEIIEEAGVGVGSFYRYFASKEDLAKGCSPIGRRRSVRRSSASRLARPTSRPPPATPSAA